MAILSKEIYLKYTCKNTPCSLMHMWSSSCIEGISIFGINAFIGSLKFFGPIYMLKLLLSWRKVNRKYLANQCKAYLRSTFYGTTYAVLFISGMCALINTVGMNYYNVLSAGILCGISILLEVPENRMLDVLMLFNQAVEGAVNLATYQRSRRKLKWAETLAFMSISSILMYLFKTQDLPPKFEHLWFYPGGSLFNKSENHWDRSHESSTGRKLSLEYALKETFKYFCIGYVLEIIKAVLSRFGVLISKPKFLFSILFNKKNILFGLFFGGYTFLYRFVSYYLLQRNGCEFSNHALIAGFIAGSTYYLRPNLQIAIIGFTTTLQLLWQRLRKKNNFPYDFPYYMIICCLSTGFIMHLRFHLDDYCPTYSRNMIHITTNNLAAKAYDTVWWIIKESEKH